MVILKSFFLWGQHDLNGPIKNKKRRGLGFISESVHKHKSFYLALLKIATFSFIFDICYSKDSNFIIYF